MKQNVAPVDSEVPDDSEYIDGYAIGWLYGHGWISKRSEKKSYCWFIPKCKKESYKLIKTFLENVTSKTHNGGEVPYAYEFGSASAKLNNYLFDKYGTIELKNGISYFLESRFTSAFRRGFVSGLLISVEK